MADRVAVIDGFIYLSIFYLKDTQYFDLYSLCPKINVFELSKYGCI